MAQLLPSAIPLPVTLCRVNRLCLLRNHHGQRRHCDQLSDEGRIRMRYDASTLHLCMRVRPYLPDSDVDIYVNIDAERRLRR